MSALTRQKSTLFQWLAVPLWIPTDENSVDLQADEIAGRQFAVQRKIEQRQITDTTFRLQPVSDQQNLLRTQSPLLAYFATFVPRRHVAARLCHLVMI